MIGAIVGAIGSQVVGGLVNNVLGGGKGGGLLEGLGGFAKNLLDPIGLFSGKKCKGETKELMGMLRDLIQELMSMLKEKGMDDNKTSARNEGHPVTIHGGSGDDKITVG